MLVRSGLIFSFLSFLLRPTKANVPWQATPFNPPAVPLAVRSPYLNCWLNQNGGGKPLTASNEWPTFWTGTVGALILTAESRLSETCTVQILGWAGLVSVDGTVFIFMGDPVIPNTNAPKTVQKSLTVKLHFMADCIVNAHIYVGHIYPKHICHDSWNCGFDYKFS